MPNEPICNGGELSPPYEAIVATTLATTLAGVAFIPIWRTVGIGASVSLTVAITLVFAWVVADLVVHKPANGLQRQRIAFDCMAALALTITLMALINGILFSGMERDWSVGAPGASTTGLWWQAIGSLAASGIVFTTAVLVLAQISQAFGLFFTRLPVATALAVQLMLSLIAFKLGSVLNPSASDVHTSTSVIRWFILWSCLDLPLLIATAVIMRKRVCGSRSD